MSSAIRRRVLTAAAGCGIMYTCMARAEGKRYDSLAIDRSTGIYLQRPSEPTDGKEAVLAEAGDVTMIR